MRTGKAALALLLPLGFVVGFVCFSSRGTGRSGLHPGPQDPAALAGLPGGPTVLAPTLPEAAAQEKDVGEGAAPAAEDAAPEEKEDAGKEKAATDPSRGGVADADPAATGVIAGTVLFEGEVREPAPLTVKKEHKDAAYCGLEIPDEKLIVDDEKQIANAVVSLVNAPSGIKGETREVTIANDKCRFVPHVVATTRNSDLLVTTKDEGIFHSAHGYGNLNGIGNAFNVAITSTRQVITRPRLKPGWTLIKCDGHEWMSAHLWVFEHPFFAVTGSDGKFTLEGVPPGDYEVQVWHEKLALGFSPETTVTKKVTVSASGKSELSFELTEPK